MKIRCKVKTTALASAVPLPKPPSRIARMLALACRIERAIEDGEVRDYADAARRLGITRARVSQILSLLYLSPELQAPVLSGSLATFERRLRNVASEPEWQAQGARASVGQRILWGHRIATPGD